MALQTPQKIRCAGLLSFFLPVEAAYRGEWLDQGGNNPKISPLRGAVISRTPPSRAPLSGAQ